MDRNAVTAWVDGYQKAWRTAGTDALAGLFAAEAGYVISPWAEPIIGLADIAEFWEDGRYGHDEAFTMLSEVIAVDGNLAIVRVAVYYYEPHPNQWRDLWVIRFDDSGRCAWFEEWPFEPDQDDGQSGESDEQSDGPEGQSDQADGQPDQAATQSADLT